MSATEPAFIIRTGSAAATERVAAALARALEPPVVLWLEGPLGAGKTTFVRGLVGALGGDPRRVKSPTFALAHSYACRPPVHHLDLYRLESADAAFDLGLHELLVDDEAIACVEWPEQAPEIFEGVRVVKVVFPANASPKRRLTIVSADFDASLERALQDAARGPRKNEGSRASKG